VRCKKKKKTWLATVSGSRIWMSGFLFLVFLKSEFFLFYFYFYIYKQEKKKKKKRQKYTFRPYI
jgi:preprotein translocase subunit YajC